jgi:hypothetical protein
VTIYRRRAGADGAVINLLGDWLRDALNPGCGDALFRFAT